MAFNAWLRAATFSDPFTRTAREMLKDAFPGSSWSRNHKRGCANDTGICRFSAAFLRNSSASKARFSAGNKSVLSAKLLIRCRLSQPELAGAGTPRLRPKDYRFALTVPQLHDVGLSLWYW